MAHVDLVVGQHASALQRLRKTFRLPHFADERRTDYMCTGGHRHADLESGIGPDLHVLLPRVVSGKARFSVSGITRSRRAALGFPAHRETLYQRAIHADVQPLWPAHAHDIVLILAAQTNGDRVFTIGWELIADGEATTRAQRQVVALPIVLEHVERNFEPIRRGNHRRQSHGEPRDLARNREIPLEVRRRNRQDVGKVVEAAVRRFIAR